MKKIFITFVSIILTINTTLAFDLVLPKEKKANVSTQYAFFVGKANPSETIYINDEHITTASNGAFAKSVKLKEGENRIILRSNFKHHVYKIYKNTASKKVQTDLIEFEPKNFIVKNNNTPLRNTPIDSGMNRISHLFKDTNIIVNGEKGDFYRVFLSKNKEAWIAKNMVIENCETAEVPQFITMNSQTFKNSTVHTIEFSKKIPYTIDESDKEIIFKAYNPMFSDNSVYTINIKKPHKYYYKTVSNSGTYQIKVTSLVTPDNKTLEGITITVDAGHGGSEKGAIGCLGDKEKDINLKIAQELKEILTSMGANVVMTRECDANVPLEERTKIAIDNNSDIFICIHLNSIPDICMNIHKNRGTSVYYYNKNSKELAKSILESVTKKISTKKEGVKTASFAVIRPTDYVGVLIEAAYMTNPLDSVIYTSDNFTKETAEGIANGIINYLYAE